MLLLGRFRWQKNARKITLKRVKLSGFWAVLSQLPICVHPYWITDELRLSRHLLALKMEEVSVVKVLRVFQKQWSSMGLMCICSLPFVSRQLPVCLCVSLRLWTSFFSFKSQTVQQAHFLQVEEDCLSAVSSNSFWAVSVYRYLC